MPKRRITKLLLAIVGLLPYGGIAFLVVWAWHQYMPSPPMPSQVSLTSAIDLFRSPIRVFLSLSLLGAWAGWYLFCKLLKYLLILSIGGI